MSLELVQVPVIKPQVVEAKIGLNAAIEGLKQLPPDDQYALILPLMRALQASMFNREPEIAGMHLPLTEGEAVAAAPDRFPVMLDSIEGFISLSGVTSRKRVSKDASSRSGGNDSVISYTPIEDGILDFEATRYKNSYDIMASTFIPSQALLNRINKGGFIPNSTVLAIIDRLQKSGLRVVPPLNIFDEREIRIICPVSTLRGNQPPEGGYLVTTVNFNREDAQPVQKEYQKNHWTDDKSKYKYVHRPTVSLTMNYTDELEPEKWTTEVEKFDCQYRVNDPLAMKSYIEEYMSTYSQVLGAFYEAVGSPVPAKSVMLQTRKTVAIPGSTLNLQGELQIQDDKACYEFMDQIEGGDTWFIYSKSSRE